MQGSLPPLLWLLGCEHLAKLNLHQARHWNSCMGVNRFQHSRDKSMHTRMSCCSKRMFSALTCRECERQPKVPFGSTSASLP